MTRTIASRLSGSLTPRTTHHPDTATNGDFLIQGNPIATLVGDGINESTSGTFDFKRDPNIPFFNPSTPVTSALLTLTLTPKDPLISTDIVAIEGLGNITTPLIQGLSIGRTSTAHLELLGFPGYTSHDILQVLSSNANSIPMRYGDNAIVSGATLELTQDDPRFLYSVRFICGESEGVIVARGSYFTTINVHNPNFKEVRFRYKMATALPNQPGQIPTFVDGRLEPDESVEIGCSQIRGLAESDEPFLKGFVTIESEDDLDVDAIYTAGAPEVSMFNTERIQPRVAKSEREQLSATERSSDIVSVPAMLAGGIQTAGDLLGQWSGRLFVPGLGGGEMNPLSINLNELGFGFVATGTFAIGGAPFTLLLPIPMQGNADAAVASFPNVISIRLGSTTNFHLLLRGTFSTGLSSDGENVKRIRGQVLLQDPIMSDTVPQLGSFSLMAFVS